MRQFLATAVFIAIAAVTTCAVAQSSSNPAGSPESVSSAEASAADQPSRTAGQPAAVPGLRAFDWLLIGIYAASTIGLGLYYSRKQQSTDDYFVGGGNIHPIFIGVSLFATLLSTISYLSMPGEALGKGPMNLVGLLSYPFTFMFVAFVLLPLYMRNRVNSAYALLEDRLGLSVRLLGATMFLALRLVWMTLLVYLAAKAMTVMIGVDWWSIDLQTYSILPGRFEVGNSSDTLPGLFRVEGDILRVSAIPVIVVFTGMVSLVYTSLGGLRAVVITDFMQTVLLFGGAVLVVATVSWEFGGFGWFPTTWQPNWDTQPIFSLDPKTRVTAVGTFLTTFTWYVATSGGDQTSVQRFMATRNASSARWALATQLIVGTVVALTLYVVGFALLGYFQRHGDLLPQGMTLANNADDMFPRYIAYHLPVGVSGLVVAAMFAAAMSSMDSGVNSITAVVMTDFLDRFGMRPKTERGHLRIAKLLAVSVGLIVVMGSTFVKYIEGNITEVTSKTVNLLTTPLFSLFLFAMFVPFAKPLGVWIGTVVGTITAGCIAFSGPLVYWLHVTTGLDPATLGVALKERTDPSTGVSWTTAEDPISFQWIGPIAIVVTVATGCLASWLTPGRARKDSGNPPPTTN